jgi:hypothetical protein
MYAFNEVYYWIGGASGNWTTNTNWSNSPGGAPASSYPQNNDDFYINTGGDIQITYNNPTTDASFKNFRISNNSKVTLINSISPSGNNRGFTINNSNSSSYFEIVEFGSTLTLKNNSFCYFTLGSDVFSSGRMVVNGDIYCIQSSFVNTSIGPRLNAKDSIIINGLFYIGNSTSATVGGNPINNNFRFGPNGIYQIDKDGGIYPYAKWEKGSLIKITGTRTNFPNYWNGFITPGYQLGGFEINAPNASNTVIGNLDIPQGAVLQNDFKILEIGTSVGVQYSQDLQFSGITIDGDLIVQKGTLSFANTSSGLTTIQVNGDLKISPSSTLDLLNGSSSTSTNLIVKGDVYLDGTIRETGNSTNVKITMSGDSIQHLQVLGSINNDVSLYVNNSRNVLALSDITWSAGAKAQLSLVTGHLDLLTNQKKIVLRNPAVDAIIGGSVSSHIIGTLVRYTNATGNYLFPVADNSIDLALVGLVPSTSTASQWTIAFNKTNPNANTGLPSGINTIVPYQWNITNNNASAAASIKLDYATIDGNGITTPADAKVVYWNSPNWISLGGLYDNLGGITTVTTPINQFGNFSLGTNSTVPTLFSTNPSIFDQVCVNTSSIDSFIIQGSNLNPGNIVIGTLNGFEFSTSIGSGYQTSLSINQSGGNLSSTKIYIKFTPTAAQNYSGVISIQGGGAAQRQVTITANASTPIVPSFSSIGPVCKNGVFTLPQTDNNNIPGSWSPAPNFLQTTTYTFTPNQGICATTKILEVVVLDSVLPTFNQVAAVCKGSILNPLPTTSTNGISGAWLPAINNLQTTTYSFTPNNGVCVSEARMEILVIDSIVPQFDINTIICKGQTSNPLPTTSTNGITGNWSPSFNNLQTTEYTFTPNPDQCAKIKLMNIEVREKVKPTFNELGSICSGQLFNALPTTSLNGVNGSWTPSINNTQTTTYSFTPEDNECSDTVQLTLLVNNCASIIYPNPNNGTFSIRIPSENNSGRVEVTIFDAKGSKIESDYYVPGLWKTRLNKVSVGVYLVVGKNEKGVILFSQKMVVSKTN